MSARNVWTDVLSSPEGFRLARVASEASCQSGQRGQPPRSMHLVKAQIIFAHCLAEFKVNTDLDQALDREAAW